MDYTIVDGKFNNNTYQRYLEEDDDIELTQTEKDLEFKVIVTEHLPREIKLKISLKNPEYVSSSAFGMDRVSI